MHTAFENLDVRWQRRPWPYLRGLSCRWSSLSPSVKVTSKLSAMALLFTINAKRKEKVLSSLYHYACTLIDRYANWCTHLRSMFTISRYIQYWFLHLISNLIRAPHIYVSPAKVGIPVSLTRSGHHADRLEALLAWGCCCCCHLRRGHLNDASAAVV